MYGAIIEMYWHNLLFLDTSLEVLLDILELRSKQVYEELVRAFVEGDDNGDGKYFVNNLLLDFYFPPYLYAICVCLYCYSVMLLFCL